MPPSTMTIGAVMRQRPSRPATSAHASSTPTQHTIAHFTRSPPHSGAYAHSAAHHPIRLFL